MHSFQHVIVSYLSDVTRSILRLKLWEGTEVTDQLKTIQVYNPYSQKYQ